MDETIRPERPRRPGEHYGGVPLRSGRPTSRYFTPSRAHRELGLYCLGVGWHDRRRFGVGHRVLDVCQAMVVSSGSGWVQISSRRRVTVRAPSVVWLFPGMEHSYQPHPGGWDETWVWFNGLALRGFRSLGLLDPDRPVVPLDDPGAVADVIGRLLSRCGGDDPMMEIDAATLIQELVTTVAGSARQTARRRADGGLVAGLIDRAFEPSTMGRHAQALGVTLADLRAATLAATGGGPKELVVQTRINRAKLLLTDTDLMVARIARDVGYDDPAYFSRLFTRQVGVSPIRFRRMRQAYEPDAPAHPALVSQGIGSTVE